MLLIVDAPMNQRCLLRGSNTHSRGGIWEFDSSRRIRQIQAPAGEWSLGPKAHRLTVKGMIPLGVRNPCPLTDPIHLPSPRMVKTPEVHLDSLTRSFPIPTLLTLVSITVVWMYGCLTVQTLDVKAGGSSAECRC